MSHSRLAQDLDYSLKNIGEFLGFQVTRTVKYDAAISRKEPNLAPLPQPSAIKVTIIQLNRIQHRSNQLTVQLWATKRGK